MKGVENLDISDSSEGAILAVKAVPGSSRDKVAGVLGDCLKVATSAPAERGKANKAVAAILAQMLGLPESGVAIVSGTTSARKQFRFAGVSADDLRFRLSAL